jgi:hypothetical protein
MNDALSIKKLELVAGTHGCLLRGMQQKKCALTSRIVLLFLPGLGPYRRFFGVLLTTIDLGRTKKCCGALEIMVVEAVRSARKFGLSISCKSKTTTCPNCQVT